MTDWIEWSGGECPVDGEARVRVIFRSEKYSFSDPNGGRADALRWNHLGNPGDIVQYIVVEAPGASTDAFAADIAEFGAAYPADYTEKPSALATQVGGNHYKGAAIQPVEFCVKNKLESLESAIVKRAFRHDKPTGKGREDVEKIIHEAQLLLELKYEAAA